jgi:hypothetical protein
MSIATPWCVHLSLYLHLKLRRKEQGIVLTFWLGFPILGFLGYTCVQCVDGVVFFVLASLFTFSIYFSNLSAMLVILSYNNK